MLRGLTILGGCLLLAGCADLKMPQFGKRSAAPQSAISDPLPLPTPELSAPPPKPGATTAEALDTTTPEQRAAVTATPAAAGGSLGTVVVTLGDPTTPGFWLRSSLVSAPEPGMIKTAGGVTVQVDLMPGEGAAQLSLAAFRAAGLSLTDLPTVEVLKR